MNLNKAMIIGNLTRDPEIRTTPQGSTVASFTVATNYIWTDQLGQKQEKAEFHNIIAWRKLAEICGQYLKKGSKIYVEGRLQTRDWTGQDGIKRFRTEIIAENMIMLDRPAGGNNFQTLNETTTTSIEEPIMEVDDPILKNNQMRKDEEIRIEDIPF